MFTRNWVVLTMACSTIATAGCGGGDGPSSADAGGAGSDGGVDGSAGNLDAATDAAGAVWGPIPGATMSWDVPAHDEQWRCHAEQVTTDQYILGFRGTPPPEQYRTWVLVRDEVDVEGDYGCSFASLSGELIYVSGKGTTGIEFPSGTGVHIAAGQWVLTMFHIDNTTGDTPAVGTSALEARLGTSDDITTELDMFLSGTTDITIPSDDTLHTVSGQCESADWTIHGMIEIMGRTALHQKLEYAPLNGRFETGLNEDFDRDSMQYVTPSPPLDIAAEQTFRLTCSYRNNTGSTATFGEQFVDDEACFLAIYREWVPPSEAPPLSDCIY